MLWPLHVSLSHIAPGVEAAAASVVLTVAVGVSIVVVAIVVNVQFCVIVVVAVGGCGGVTADLGARAAELGRWAASVEDVTAMLSVWAAFFWVVEGGDW